VHPPRRARAPRPWSTTKGADNGAAVCDARVFMGLSRAHAFVSGVVAVASLAALDVYNVYNDAVASRPGQLADFIARTTTDSRDMFIAFCTS
jgi:hypothetical protein